MSHPHNRVFLGIDYGSKRIGISRSDPSGLIASAVTTLEVKSRNDALRQLQELIASSQPDGLVFGYPYLASGEKSAKCLEIDRFIELVSETYSGPVHRYDERYTSEDAIRVVVAHGKKSGKNKGRIDRIAAVLILQRFLDEQFNSDSDA